MKTRLLHCLLSLFAVGSLAAAESNYYELQTYPIPDDLKLEVSGLALLPDGRMACAIRKGEIWIIEHAESGNPQDVRYKLFATGLHEPLGLAWRDGALYTVQRTELTKIRDTDNDGTADEYITFAKGWGVTGNYHEYAYGPQFDTQGNAWITLNCSIGKGSAPSDNAWRGWSLRVKPDGTMEPVSGGFRSPSGVGMNLAGDVFATDQQGNWFPTCALIHLREGVFHGHADALAFTDLPGATFKITGQLPQNITVVEAAKRIPEYRLPPVWFPYRKMGMSATDVLCDTTGGAFGPFEGQLFVGEFTMSFVLRVFLEKVNGEYQGACFRFREGMQSAVLRMEWGGDGSMFIGESNRGWNSLGTRAYGLQRLVWTGRVPFEIKEMHAKSDGFELIFTQAVDREAAADPKSYELSSYTYLYHQTYGSEEIDTKPCAIKSVRISQDGRSVRLIVDGLRAGHVHELRAGGVRSVSGKPLLHDLACYTLNQIPSP